jgi:hypothetical protein
VRTLTFYIMFTNNEDDETYKSPNFKIDVKDEGPYPSTIAQTQIRDMLEAVVDPDINYKIYFIHST